MPFCFNKCGFKEAYGASKLNILYAHGPDKKTPIAEQAAAFDKQFRLGRFAALGVSNFNADMLQQWIDIADKHGYVKPSVYQGEPDWKHPVLGPFSIVRSSGDRIPLQFRAPCLTNLIIQGNTTSSAVGLRPPSSRSCVAIIYNSQRIVH